MEKRNLYWSKKAAGDSKGAGDRWSQFPKGKMEKIENRVGRREEMKPLTQINCYRPRRPPPATPPTPTPAAPQGRNASDHGSVPPLDGLIESTLSLSSGGGPVYFRVEDSHRVFAPETGDPDSQDPLSLFPIQPEIFPGRPSRSFPPALEHLISACPCAIYPANGAGLITSTQP